MAEKVKLAGVRLSFPDLFEAKDYQDNKKFRYSAAFLVEPGSANDKTIQAAIVKVANEEFGKTAAAKLEAFKGNANKFCYLKGESKEYEGYQGMMALSSHRKQEAGRPLVIDQQKQPLTAADGKPYAGCYVNATVEIWAQGGQNAGIRCALLGVQFARDGDAFSGGAAASPDDFDELPMEEGATADDLM